MRWVTAQDLQLWAGRLDCEGTLPELIRRLAHATVNAFETISFPSGESVHTGGWDGIIRTSVGNEYIPNGWSGWELSKRGDTRTKADDDYDKRTNDPEHIDRTKRVFIFVTPRRWNAKEEWVAAKKAAGKWADVRAYDADDLEQWLERAPAVGAWLARILRKYPAGVLSIEDYWGEYSLSTSPQFTNEIVIAGRKADAERIAEWLQHGTATLSVAADSPQEAFAFVAACTSFLGTDQEAHVRSRFVLSDDPILLRELITTGEDLILGWLAINTGSIGVAVHQGHRVVVATAADRTREDICILTRPAPEALISALKDAGLTEDRAKTMVRDTGSSITVIHRLLMSTPTPPAWAMSAHARDIIPAVLANAWDEQQDEDQYVVAGLAAIDYAAVSAAMARWSHVPDAPVQQAGTVWTIRALRDAWHLLSPYLTKHDIDRFRVAMKAVLGVTDPSLELPPGERWLANLRRKDFPHSSWLRNGLSQTLVLISLTPTIAGHRGSDIAGSIVGEILRGGWQRWYSVVAQLALLAESAPATFLSELEDRLDQDSEGIDNLFVKLGPFHGDHSGGLLWALELLAWYPEHLTRVALLLGRLARKHKQPLGVLRAIFLTWLPQTAASIQDRTTTLRVLLNHEPTVGWALLMGLWPQHFDSGAYHYEPQWRDKPAMRPITDEDRIDAQMAVVQLALESVGTDPQCLIDLIHHIGTTPPDARARLREHLQAFAADVADVDQRLSVWSAIRDETNKQRHFHNAQWALPETEIATFDPIVAALAPKDLIDRYAWLFQSHYPMLGWDNFDHSVIDAALAAERTKALQQITASYGIDSICDLAKRVKIPVLVGITALAINADEVTMLRLLASEDESVRICGMGYASERYRLEGMRWVDETLGKHAEWNGNTRAALLLAIPSDRATWDRVERFSVVPEYWRRAMPLLGTASDDITYGVSHLLEAGQVSQAFERASMNAGKLPSAMLRQSLDSLLALLQDQKQPVDHLVSYYLVQIFNALDERQDIDLAAIALYEWAFLPLLRGERDLRLHNHIAAAPDLFAQMVKSIYLTPAESGRPEATQQEVARARQAYDLLSSWRTIPGAKPDGKIDPKELSGWVDAARAACEAQRDACDDQIGKVLAWAPKGADGIWPHEAVRAIIERLRSRVLEDGFRTGVLNKRGAFAIDPFAGGASERPLAAQYRTLAQALAAGNPRTSAVLSEIAEHYERTGQHQHIRAEHLRLEH